MTSALFGLDEEAELVYRTALARHVVVPEVLAGWLRWPVEQVRAAVATLVDQGIVVPTEDGMRVLHPDEAAELRLRSQVREAEQLRATLADETASFRSGALGQHASGRLRPTTTSGVEVVTSAARISAIVADLQQRALRRLDFLAPWSDGPDSWENAIVDRRLADRKVRVQGVWFERQFAVQPPSPAVRDLAAAHGVRTVDGFSMKAVVWDHKVAIVPQDPTALESAALVVVQPALVAGVAEMVERHWARGRRWAGPQPAGLTTRHRTVLGLLVQGLTDDAIARRLGIGERTVRRDVAQMSDLLGVSGRVALGAEAVRRGLVD